MQRQRVRVFAPATVSNVGPGFDVLGFALHRPGDWVEAEASDRPGVELLEVTGDGGALPVDARRNAAGVAARRLWRQARGGRPAGLRMRLQKGTPLASGLGSSGASAAAGAMAANQLLECPLPLETLVACAMDGERAACGSAHADNVAPSLAGGIVLIRSYLPLELVQLPVPDGLFVAVVHPHCRVSTGEARARLAGRAFPLPDIVANAGNLAALVAALYRGDLELLGRAIEDRLVEPVRAAMIPAYDAVRRAARDEGALACAVSGSGPSMFAVADAHDAAAAAASAMRRAFRAGASLASDAWVGPISRRGAAPVE
ncbi:MAG TPA: homoserine kinase [Vicinamibacterales bacterium]|nr:homoserine kinase [Vicinamibacterales bacterium]HOQ60378.1 homoserine kinase [Vicinamibacterales bacterium]